MVNKNNNAMHFATDGGGYISSWRPFKVHRGRGSTKSEKKMKNEEGKRVMV